MMRIINSHVHILNIPNLHFNTQTRTHTLMSYPDKENFYHIFQDIGFF